MDDIKFYDEPMAPKKGNASKKLVYIVIILIIIAAIALAASRFLAGNKKQASTTSQPTPTAYVFPTTGPTATSSASTTPGVTGKTTPAVSPTGATRSSYSVAVENGSGTAGAASKMATTLKNLGYTVASTGNADAFTYTGITIEVKSGDSKLAQRLKQDLSSSYTITATTTNLPTSSTNDAVVIVGK